MVVKETDIAQVAVGAQAVVHMVVQAEVEPLAEVQMQDLVI